MDLKFVILAALVSCAAGAYIQQQSAASASQIKYAESQNYDQTNPGDAQKQPQAQQVSLQAYNQQPQQYSHQPQQYSSQPQQYSFVHQPQVYSQPQQQILIPQAPHQPVAYSQQNQVLAARPSLAHQQPQLVYSQHQAPQISHAPQVSFQFQPQALKQVQVNTLQQEYEAAPQHSFEAQDGLNSKFQYSQPEQVSNAVLHQQIAPKYVFQQSQPQIASLVPKHQAPLRASLSYQTIAASAQKAFYPTPASPIGKYTPNQQYAYSQ